MTKNVTMVIPFRDNEKDVIRLFNVVSALDWPPKQLRIVCVEGDSKDNTYTLLKWWEEDLLQFDKVTVIKKDLDVPKYPSAVHPERFYALATTFNVGLETAIADDWTDFVFLIPSDLRFDPDVIKRLVAYDKPHIAPMYWISLGGTVVFYDMWGFREKGGANWGNFKKSQWKVPDIPFQMDTAGGPAMIRRDVLDTGCRYTVEKVDNGLCEMIWERGFSVWVAPDVNVYHAPR